MSRDPLDSFEDALFRAARRERPQGDALERTTSAVVSSYRRQRSRRSLFAFGAAVALAAGAAMVLRSGPSVAPIQAERIVPKHSVSSVAAPPSLPETEQSAVPMRSGLAPSVASTTLEEELVMLDRARSALAAGDAASTLTQLDRYDRVSGGHLTSEATLLRIQALASSGRASSASKLARTFVDSDPNSPLAARARSYVSEPPAPHVQPSSRVGAGAKP